MSDRIARQIAFLCEADRLKTVRRANVLMDLSRSENSAEHSWHAALWAMVFGGSDRAIAMLLLAPQGAAAVKLGITFIGKTKCIRNR